MKDETLLQSRENFISLCNKFWNWQELDEITAGEEEPRLEWDGQEFTHRVTRALWRMYQSALQSGNSVQPVTVPDGYVLVPVEPTEDMVINGFESEPDEHFSDSSAWEAYNAMSGCQQAAHRATLCWAAMIAAAPKGV